MSDNWKNMLFFQLFISNGSNKRRLIIMDKLFCESCGSNEFEEINGIQVCKYCGTQFVPQFTEEQLKIKAEVERFTKGAELSLSVQDWERAESLYSKVSDLDPGNIEMIFFMAYCKLRESLQVAKSPLQRQNLGNVLMNSFELVKNNYNYSSDDSVKSIEKFGKYINDLVHSTFIYNIKKNRYGFEESNNRDETAVIIIQIMMKFILMTEDIIHHYSINGETIKYIRRLNEVSAKLLENVDLVKAIPLDNDELVERANLVQRHIRQRKMILENDNDVVNNYKNFEYGSEKVALKTEETNNNNLHLAWYEIIIGILVLYWLFF